MKKLISCLLLLGVMAVFFVNAQAAIPDILPLWDNTLDASNNIVFEGTNGSAIGEITGKADTARIEATMTVYRLVNDEWVYVTQNSAAVNSRYLYFSADFTAEEGGYYKSILVFHVTNSQGVTESLQRAKYASN